MRNAVKWTALVLAILLLLYTASVVVRLAVFMQEDGWTPWSWDFVQTNLVQVVIIPGLGIVLLAVAVTLFVRGADRS